MMVPFVFVGIGAGVAAALLFLSPMGGTALAYPLFLLAGLPVAIAGLAWTPVAALIASVTAAAIAFLALGPIAAAVFLLIFGGPLTWMTRLVTLSRPGDGADASKREWYPLGHVLLHGAAAISVGMILVGVIIGFDPDTLAVEMTDALAAWLAGAPDIGMPPTAAELQPFVRFNLSVLPFTVTAITLMVLVVNLWLGAKIAAASGRLERPRDRLWTVSLPNELALAFVIAAPLALFLPGAVGEMAGVVAGAFGAAVALVGLAVLHALTLGNNLRVLILVVAYVVLVLFGFPIILLALLGLSESVFHLRARRFANAPPPT